MLGRTPLNNIFCLRKIWLSKIFIGQKFGSKKALPEILPKLNIFDLSLVFSDLVYKSETKRHTTHVKIRVGLMADI